MGRGTRNAVQAISSQDLRRPARAGRPAWLSGDITADERWHAARQAKRLLIAPKPGASARVDARVLAQAVADLRAVDAALDRADLRAAYSELLKVNDTVDVTVAQSPSRQASFSGGASAAVLTPSDPVLVSVPHLTGDRPVELAARHLGLERIPQAASRLSDLSQPV